MSDLVVLIPFNLETVIALLSYKGRQHFLTYNWITGQISENHLQ